MPNIVGVKDAAGNPAASARLIADAPAGFELYSGDDDLTLPLLAVGAVGVISVAAHWAGEVIARDGRRLRQGRRRPRPVAQRPADRLVGRSRAATLTPNPIPTKAMLRVLGLPAGQCRLPLGPAPDGARGASGRAVLAASRTCHVADPVRLTFLGGLGEIGRNCACLEVGGRILIIDCGLMFPDLSMPGVDLVLPDFSWLKENADRVEACVLTHGHEDHVGALSYLLRDLSFPIYGSALTLGLARSRIDEAGLLDRTQLIPVADGERRVDRAVRRRVHPRRPLRPPRLRHRHPHPAGRRPALRRLEDRPDARSTAAAPTWPASAPIATTEGVRLLLADSTNAEEPGPHGQRARGRHRPAPPVRRAPAASASIVACFASHIHRIQEIADAAVAHGRVVATLGRSMAQEPDARPRARPALASPTPTSSTSSRSPTTRPSGCASCRTGSQGEPMSALALMAAGENRFVKLGPGDTVIISAHPIPGNEHSVSQVIDGLHRLGADVVHSGPGPGARQRARQAGRDQDAALGGPARATSSRCTASSAT